MLEHFRTNRILGAEVVDMDDMRRCKPDMFDESGGMVWQVFDNEIRPYKYIYIRREKNSITFNLQNGPIKEKGVNGCQIDCMIEAARHMIAEANQVFPCRENAIAITKLEEALLWLHKRKLDREYNGVVN
jgi:hypothetical protein